MNDLYYDFGFGPVPAHPHPKGGGWVANTAKVDDTCYVGPYAQVYGKAYVSKNAKVDGYAQVFGDARVTDEARIYGAAKVYQSAMVSGRARVSGEARVYGTSIVTDDALVYENAEVYENSRVRNYCEVHGNAKVRANANLIENAKIYDNCIVTRQPLIITGVAAAIIVTDHHASIGCITLPPSIWKEHGKTMVRFFTKFPGVNSPRIISEKWIDGLSFAVDIHGCTDIPEEIANFKIKETISKILSDDRFWIQND
jgi:carbonic anhydrase/acetyltransferase-like protein (isoleucine patch superfamily)